MTEGEGKILAQVIRSSQRQFSCKTKGGEIVEATALGNLLKGDCIVVGDRVELTTIAETGEYQINAVIERESEIFRISIREQKKKVTAANCNLLVILSSVSKPAYKQGIVDRFLVRACQWGIRPIVVFNKCDELESSEVDLKFERDRLIPLGVECFEISAHQMDDYQLKELDKGWAQLNETLKDRTAIFLGQSGVGKSRTISALSGGVIDLKTHVVGKVGKGSHTTTWSELIELPHFNLIDSPGIRSFSLEDINPEDLIALFPDLEEVAIHCKFNNCQHEESSKGCAFHHNDWDSHKKECYFSRLASFKRIVEETAQTPTWSKKL